MEKDHSFQENVSASDEEQDVLSRREYLISLKKWSKAVIGGILLGGSMSSCGGSWVNAGGGWIDHGVSVGWTNRRGGWRNGGGSSWKNSRSDPGRGGGSWGNRR